MYEFHLTTKYICDLFSNWNRLFIFELLNKANYHNYITIYTLQHKVDEAANSECWLLGTTPQWRSSYLSPTTAKHTIAIQSRATALKY